MLTLDENLFLWINGLAGNIAPLDWFIQRIANDYVIIVSACFILLLLWFSTRNAALRERNQKAVACAAHGLQVAWLLWISLDLAAQTGDLNIHSAFLRLTAVTA